MELKDRIKSLRSERHLAQAQIAEALGVDQSTVSYWEKGRQEPNTLQRKKLCQFLKITQSQLFEGL